MELIGSYALILALALAIYGTFASFFAGYLARERFRVAAIRAYIGASALVLVAIICMGILLQQDSFDLVYIYSHSNRALPWYFKFTAIWGGSQGSLMFWTLIMCVYTVVYIYLTRNAPRLMISWSLGFIGVTLVFFLAINNFVAPPFNIWAEVLNGNNLAFVPDDGNGLNPQLQHWAMIIHPPLLYMGYIGFLFPFAMALGALITRMEGRDWIHLIRRWTLVAWLILGVGIILGGGWAYMELGWGGYWAWDPVENASFMPWLLSTAFVHSIMAQEKRGMFKMWNILLLMGSYLMCILGTGITRSGLISSVHAFAESDIGYYFGTYLLVFSILCVVVLIARRDQLRDDASVISMSSRETSFLFNNVLFIAISFTMFMATIYPMITEALYNEKRELRHNFYNSVELPIFMLLMLLMAIGPVLTWKRTSERRLRERFLIPSIIMVVAWFVGLLLTGVISSNGFSTMLFGEYWMPVTSYAILTFLLVTIIHEFLEVGMRRAKRAGENLFTAMISITRMNKRRYGGYICHFSVLIMAFGITGSAFNHQAKEEMGIGETMTVAGFTFQVADLGFNLTDNFQAAIANVNMLKDGEILATFEPEQRYYLASEMQASEVSIVSNLARDYYVVLAGMSSKSTNEHPIGVFHVYVNPLVLWIWIGSVLMVLGTVIALLPDKVPVRHKAQATVGMEEAA